MGHARQRLRLILLLALGLVTAGLWYWRHDPGTAVSRRADTRQAQPPRAYPPGDPAIIADSSAWARNLAARGDSRDIGALTSTFKEAADCLLHHSARQELAVIFSDPRRADLSRETPETIRHLDATSDRYLSIIRRTESLCRGSDPGTVARVYSESVMHAALAGSADAQSCFVTSDGAMPGEHLSQAAWNFYEERYMKHAPAFTQSALERADPYVAARSLARYVVSNPVHPSARDDLPMPDPILTYQAARLAALRAVPEQHRRMEHYLSEFEKKRILQPDDLLHAQEWAKSMYERDFAGQRPINPFSNAPCHSDPSLAP